MFMIICWGLREKRPSGAPAVGVSAEGLLRQKEYKKRGIGNTSPEFLKEIRAPGFLEELAWRPILTHVFCTLFD